MARLNRKQGNEDNPNFLRNIEVRVNRNISEKDRKRAEAKDLEKERANAPANACRSLEGINTYMHLDPSESELLDQILKDVNPDKFVSKNVLQRVAEHLNKRFEEVTSLFESLKEKICKVFKLDPLTCKLSLVNSEA